jgi:H+/Cl- antiporter ClcA
MNFFFGIILIIIGQILAFFQMQGHLKFQWLKDNLWFPVLLGIPISIIFMTGMSLLIRNYGGSLWPSRIIGFSIGTIIYGIMAWYFFNEKVSFKTGVCLFLSLLIILIQVFWKE